MGPGDQAFIDAVGVYTAVRSAVADGYKWHGRSLHRPSVGMEGLSPPKLIWGWQQAHCLDASHMVIGSATQISSEEAEAPLREGM